MHSKFKEKFCIIQKLLEDTNQDAISENEKKSIASFKSLNLNENRTAANSTSTDTTDIESSKARSVINESEGGSVSRDLLNIPLNETVNAKQFPKTQIQEENNSVHEYRPYKNTQLRAPKRTLSNPGALFEYPNSFETTVGRKLDPEALPYKPFHPPNANKMPSRSSSPYRSKVNYSSFENNPKRTTENNCTSTNNLQELLAKQLLTKDLIKNSIEPFDGTSYKFWSWMQQVNQRVESLSLSASEFIQVLESNSIGDARKVIIDFRSSCGHISQEKADEMVDILTERYGSTSIIAKGLLDKLKRFPAVKPPNIEKTLRDLVDLCRLILFNMNDTPELQFLNIANGAELIREKLPHFIRDR